MTTIKRSWLIGGSIFIVIAFIIAYVAQTKTLTLSRETYLLISLIFALSALIFVITTMVKVMVMNKQPAMKVAEIENTPRDYWAKSYYIFLLLTCLAGFCLFLLLISRATILSQFTEFDFASARAYSILIVLLSLFGLCAYLFKKHSRWAIPTGYTITIICLLIQIYLSITNLKVNLSTVITYVIYYQLLRTIRKAQIYKIGS